MAKGLDFMQLSLEVCSSLFSIGKNSRVLLTHLKDEIHLVHVPSSYCMTFLSCYSRLLWTRAHTIDPSLLPYLLTITCPPPSVSIPHGCGVERDRSPGSGKKYGQKGASLAERFWYQKEREFSRAMTAQDTIH